MQAFRSSFKTQAHLLADHSPPLNPPRTRNPQVQARRAAPRARLRGARKQGRFERRGQEYSRTLALAPRHFKALFSRGFSYDKVRGGGAAAAAGPGFGCGRCSGKEPLTRQQHLEGSSSTTTTSSSSSSSSVQHTPSPPTPLNPTPHRHPQQLGQYALAVIDYSAALALCPDNSFALYNRGTTKDRMGDYPGAVEDFTAAAALDPNNARLLPQPRVLAAQEVRAGDCQQPASRDERMLHSPPVE